MTMNDRPRRISPVVLLGFLLLCPSTLTAAPSSSNLRVTVTVPPLVWLVSEVAGPDVDVDHLVRAGEAPETFQPTDHHITGVARSTVLFRVGVASENSPWLHALEASQRVQVVDLRLGLPLREMKACLDDHHNPAHHSPSHDRPSHDSPSRHNHSHSRVVKARERDENVEDRAMDPHTWLSPSRLIIMTRTVARSLAAADPPRAIRYAERAQKLVARLEALDAELEQRLAVVQGKTFLVFHPAWGYFAEDYGLRQQAIEIEGKEPSDQEITQLVREAQSLKIRTLFVQPQIRSAVPQAVARAIGAKVETLDPLAMDLPANLRRTADLLVAALSPDDGEL